MTKKESDIIRAIIDRQLCLQIRVQAGQSTAVAKGSLLEVWDKLWPDTSQFFLEDEWRTSDAIHPNSSPRSNQSSKSSHEMSHLSIGVAVSRCLQHGIPFRSCEEANRNESHFLPLD